MIRAWLLWHSMRHTRMSQLAARLKLTSKRVFMTRIGTIITRMRPWTTPAPSVSEHPPHPLFPPRRELVEESDGLTYLRYLNRRDHLERFPNWHPAELEVGTRLEKLNLHYMEYLEAVDDASFQALIEHWIDHNPPYRAGYWLDNWNSYALSIRCVVWMQQYAIRRKKLSKTFVCKMSASLDRQLRFLEHNLELDIRGNHLIKNIKALLWASRFFDMHPSTPRWQSLCHTLLQTELHHQILPDGMHEERSPAYHCQVFSDLLECYAVLPESKVRRNLAAALSAMAGVSANLTHPDGMISLFNDGGLNMTYKPQDCLQVWHTLTGEVVEPADCFALHAAGYFGLREQGNYLLIDCGPIGPDHLPAHSHGDMLAFEWDLAGQRMIVDAGVYEYHPGQWRDYARATASHNTVTIDKTDQCEFWGAFRVGRRGRATLHRFVEGRCQLFLEGSQNGYSRLPGRPVHHREFDATSRRIVVRDRVVGGVGQPVQARLLLHPNCQIEFGENVVILKTRGVTGRLRTHSPVQAIKAWWMPDFGVCHETIQLVLDHGPCPCEGSFVLEAVD